MLRVRNVFLTEILELEKVFVFPGQGTRNGYRNVPLNHILELEKVLLYLQAEAQEIELRFCF